MPVYRVKDLEARKEKLEKLLEQYPSNVQTPPNSQDKKYRNDLSTINYILKQPRIENGNSIQVPYSLMVSVAK